MNSILAIALLLAVLATVILFLRSGSVSSALAQAQGRSTDLEKRLTEAQEALNTAREDLKRKASALEEAREKVQKAKQKEVRKEKLAERPAMAPQAPANASAEEKMREQRYIAAVENAEKRAQAAEKALASQTETIRGEARVAFEAELNDLRSRLQKAESKLRQKDEEPVRTIKHDEPVGHVPGTKIDLKALAPDVVQELGRFYKRAQVAEKLSVFQEKSLELAQDKLEELQKRYFAVCRELALVAVNKDKPQEVSDAEAARLAQDMVRASEQAGRIRAAHKPQNERRREPRPEGEAQETASAEGGRPGRDSRRQRRPRRDLPRREGGAEAGAPEQTAASEQKPETPAASPAPTTTTTQS